MSTTTWTKKSRRHLDAEPGSLRDWISAHSRYIPPIGWQPDLLRDIDCDVLQLSTDDSRSDTIPAVDDYRIADELCILRGAPVRMKKDEIARRLFRLLIPMDLSFEVSRSVWDLPLFKSEKLTPHSDPPRLLLDGSPVAKTPSSLVFRSTITSRPIFAFVDKTWLCDQRQQFLERKGLPTAYKTAHEMIKLDFDPYIASLLISMAQNSFSAISDDAIQVIARPFCITCFHSADNFPGSRVLSIR
jgi:hypothetical protein